MKNEELLCVSTYYLSAMLNFNSVLQKMKVFMLCVLKSGIRNGIEMKINIRVVVINNIIYD